MCQALSTRNHKQANPAQVLDRLTPVEQQLLSQRLTQLRHVLDPGFSPLNWNSLGIPDFVATCNRVSMCIDQEKFRPATQMLCKLAQ